MPKLVLSLICTWLALTVNGQTLPAPKNLRCDLLLHTGTVRANGIIATVPLAAAAGQPDTYQIAAITSNQPAFSWEVDKAVTYLTGYRVLVASSPQLLTENKADLWDSGRVKSTHSRADYAGKPLAAGRVYYWKVQAWNEAGGQLPFSKMASFYYGAPNPAERFAHYPLTAEVQQPVELKSTAPGSYFIDFGKDALAQLQLQLTSETADTLWISVGEAIEKPYAIHTNPGRNIRYLRLPLLLKKGTHTYTVEWPANPKRDSRNPVFMPAYIGEVYPFRYVSFTKYSGQLGPQSVTRRMVSYPFDEKASSFTSSDTVLNQVWDLCKYSIKATSFTGYYVDGDRERIPYEADALINQLSHYAVDAEYSMARRSMTYLLYHPTWPTEWSLQNVLIAWTDYQYTGNNGLLTTYYPELQKKILMPLAGKDGLISTRTNKQTDDFLRSIHIDKLFDGRRGLHDIVDWPQNGDYVGTEKEHAGENDGFVYRPYNAVVNAYYYRNLVLMKQIALALHKPDDAAFYERNARQVYDAFRTMFRDPKTGLINDGDSTSHRSLHANMFALAFGLVPAEDKETVSRFVKSRGMACSVYGAQFLMDALYDAGMDEYALSLMTATTQRSWYNMIRSGSTITLEAWDKLYKPNLDLNHAWGAVPANIIVRKLMGIEPLTPGFDTIQIKPQLGKLTYATLRTSTIRGEVAVTYKKEGATETMDVSIPGGVTATVYLKGHSTETKLYLDGKLIRNQVDNGFVRVDNVPAGAHAFVLKN